jgi:hypothetical protein
MSSLPTSANSGPTPAPQGENAETALFRAALEDLLASRRIALTEPQRRLLDYLGHNSLDHPHEPLKEYTIGVEAFGRPSTYNPQEDSSVRVQAGRLRQRLEHYFEHEGSREEVVVRLLKGSFLVTFERRRIEPWRLRLRFPMYRYAAGLLLLTQAVTGGLLWKLYRQSDTELAAAGKALATPALADFWSGFLEPGRPIVIAVGGPLFARFDTSYYRDAAYQRWEDLIKDEKFQRVAGLIGGHPPKAAAQSFTGLGELAGVFCLSRYLFTQGRDPNLRLSGGLSWNDFRTNNIVLLGSYKTFPYWHEIAPHLNFALEQGIVANRHPQPGEPAAWSGVWSAEFSYVVKDYAIVTRLADFEGIKNALLVEAGSGEAGLGACQYLTDSSRVQDLQRRIGAPRTGHAASLQVVLASTCRAQIPLETTYVTHRWLP